MLMFCSGDGHFAPATAIATDSSDNIYFTDSDSPQQQLISLPLTAHLLLLWVSPASAIANLSPQIQYTCTLMIMYPLAILVKIIVYKSLTAMVISL